MERATAGAAHAAEFEYSGRDNLAAMREAHRYNGYLIDLITSHAPPAGRWLDFGAGEGQFAIPLARAGREVTALEVDPQLAQVMSQAGVPTCASLDELADGSLDYAYSLNVLEHISDDGAALRGLFRVLAPGGALLLYVPAFQHLYSTMDARVGHFRRYRGSTLRPLVEHAGFSVSEVRYVDVLGYFASLAYKGLPQDGTISPRSVAAYDRWVFPLSRGLDRLTSRWLGKNLSLVARKPR